MEERMEKIKENNTEKRHSQKRAGGYAIRFFGCWLLTVALAVGMFLFWNCVIFLGKKTGQKAYAFCPACFPVVYFVLHCFR